MPFIFCVWNMILLYDQERETELKKHLQESERRCREKECELMRKLDEVTLTASQVALDRTRLANEKLRLEQEVRRHEAQEAELVREKKDAENCLLVAKEQLEKQVFKRMLHFSCSKIFVWETFRKPTFNFVVWRYLYLKLQHKSHVLYPARTQDFYCHVEVFFGDTMIHDERNNNLSMHNFILPIVKAATHFGNVKQPLSGCEYRKCKKGNYIPIALHKIIIYCKMFFMCNIHKPYVFICSIGMCRI